MGMSAMSVGPGGIESARKQSDFYYAINTQGPGGVNNPWQQLAEAMGLTIATSPISGHINWYWPGFTEVGFFEQVYDLTWEITIKLRSGVTAVLSDPIENYPSKKLINAINLLRD